MHGFVCALLLFQSAGVHDDFFFALRGSDSKYLNRAAGCERALEADPNDGQALLCHGAALFFRARSAYKRGDIEEAGKYFSACKRELDKAVSLKKSEPDCRMVRGLVLLEATRELNGMLRDDQPLLTGLQDFEAVLSAREAAFPTLSGHRRGELLFALAEGWARAGNEAKARRYFERLAKELGGTPYAARAQSWLNTRSLTPVHMKCVGCHVN